jgi:hypothetical protein
VNKPTLVYHADWSSSPAKRWCAKATLGADGRYTASAPEPVGELGDLLANLRTKARNAGCVFAGFDFPIGVPDHYATRVGILSIREFLPRLGTGVWKQFYSVCEEPEQISLHRPFYPSRSEGGHLRQHLLNSHQALDMASLLRRCELGGGGRRQACCLFWTLGSNQVGKAAIVGWKDMLVPALQTGSVRLWPFDGALDSLLQPGNVVIAETYPAECYGWFNCALPDSKTDIECRKKFGSEMLTWARANDIEIERPLKDAIESGFPQGRDDAFDAVVGLFGMLQVCIGQRDSGEPNEDMVRNIEGWILGRESRPDERPRTPCSAANDPELRDWLRWASENGEAPNFVRAIGEAAYLADLPQYSLLRPVLLELKRRNPLSP